jgi:hypothetical protein
MSHDLTMSMRVDRHEAFPGVTIQPRIPTAWIPDERVRRCFACNTAFSIFRRKHHCRSCGRVFCDSCTAYRERLPSYFQYQGPSPIQRGSATHRMCAPCASSSKKAFKVEWLVRALSVMPLSFPELFRVRLLNRTWNQAANTLLSLYRGLQYKLPGKRYSRIEADFLKTHYAEFGHHIPWQVHAFCSAAHRKQLSTFRAHIDTHHRLSCKRLLCSRVCSTRLTIDNILHLALSSCLQSQYLMQAVINAWFDIVPEVHHKMMNWWVYVSCSQTELFWSGLIPMCSKRLELVYALWFECELQKSDTNTSLLKIVQYELLNRVRESVQNDLNTSFLWVQLLKSIVCKNGKRLHDKLLKAFFEQHRQVRLPWNPSCVVVSMTSTKRFSSSSRPLSLTCITETGRKLCILIKQEDVRTDRLSMVVAYWIRNVTHQFIHTYDVFPFTKDMGCMVMIPGAATLYDVRKTTSLLNYIMTRNAHETVRKVRGRIVRSCAGACLLAFAMGLGDRHLENILVGSDGSLAHVDFGYVLGEDPKHVSTPMRITDEMVDAMGGHASPTFVAFIQKTQKGYETMRQHASLWYHLLAAECYIHQHPSRTLDRVRQHVSNRFVPGEWNEEASLHIQTVVQRASEDSYFQQAADFVHEASNRCTELFQMEL